MNCIKIITILFCQHFSKMRFVVFFFSIFVAACALNVIVGAALGIIMSRLLRIRPDLSDQVERAGLITGSISARLALESPNSTGKPL